MTKNAIPASCLVPIPIELEAYALRLRILCGLPDRGRTPRAQRHLTMPSQSDLPGTLVQDRLRRPRAIGGGPSAFLDQNRSFQARAPFSGRARTICAALADFDPVALWGATGFLCLTKQSGRRSALIYRIEQFVDFFRIWNLYVMGNRQFNVFPSRFGSGALAARFDRG